MRTPPIPNHLNWTDYHQSVRRIAAKFNPHHGNYRIHDHEFVEMAFVVSGTCLHHTVLGDCRPGPGDVYLFRPGAWHGYSEAKKFSMYNCCFDTALLGRELSWLADEPYLGRLLWGIPLSTQQQGMVALHLSPPEFKRCSKLLDELCRLAKKDYLSHYGDHLGLLLNILSILARNAAAKSGNKTMTSHRAVVSAIKMIDDAPREVWTLTTLAARVHIEPTYFSRLFHTAVGLPPMAYLTRRRLELATSLLRRDDLPVGEVGAMAGWEDQNYFSRCFRKYFGMTPSRYRARFMEGKIRPPVAIKEAVNR